MGIMVEFKRWCIDKLPDEGRISPKRVEVNKELLLYMLAAHMSVL
jgi:hypothetical protein